MHTHARWMAGTIVMATVGVWSSTARADCVVDLPPLSVPFDGLSIPANAELRVVNAFNVSFELTLPDGSTQSSAFIADEIGHVLDLDVRALPPGPYAFTIDGTAGSFELLAEVDTVAPPPPLVTYDTASTFTGPSLPYAECPGKAGFSSTATFTVEGAEPGDVVVVNGRVFSADDITIAGGVVDSAFVLRDLAGNESEATLVPVEGGCGGCTSADVSPFALALLALLRRRR